MACSFSTTIFWDVFKSLVKYSIRKILILGHTEHYKLCGNWNYTGIVKTNNFAISLTLSVVLSDIFRIY